MCTVCGCSDEKTIETGQTDNPGDKPGSVHDHGHAHGHGPAQAHDHHRHDGDPHVHDPHHHGHSHGADGSLDFGAGQAGVHVPGQSQARLIEIETSILSKNDQIAAINRQRLESEGVVAINLMSSPGSGKTSLLVETLKALKDEAPCAVIEGDQQTSNDAARIRQAGVPAIQINTGKGCHLDAEMVRSGLDHLPSQAGGFVFIENVGNLVCPAAFDLGEARRVVVASITEGEDKPLKYPEMFARADLLVVSKLDLLPHLDFDLDLFIANARKVAPRIDVVSSSIRGAPGLDSWLAWLRGLRVQRGVAAE